MIRRTTTDRSVWIRIIDETDGTPETGVVAATPGLALNYQRTRAAVTALTPVDLAAVDAAHADGGIKHVGNGYYRLDLPDAAVAPGADSVLVTGTATGMVVMGAVVDLTAANLAGAQGQSGSLPVYDDIEALSAAINGSIAALHNLSAAEAEAAVDAALANYDPPTHAETTAAAQAAKLAADGLALVTAETGLDVREALSLILAAVLGKLSGVGGGTITLYAPDGATIRAVVTVDGTGNRSATILTPS